MQRYAVIGLGRFGYRLAELLSAAGQEVVAIDRNKAVVNEIAPLVTRAVCMDASNEEALKAQGIADVDVAIIGIGENFEAAVLATDLLKQLRVPQVLARSTTVTRAKILKRVGADRIVSPERETADRWRDRLLTPNMIEQIELAEDCRLVRIPAPTRYVGKTLGQLDIRRNDSVQVVAIRRTVQDTDNDGRRTSQAIVISVPSADTQVHEGDTLIMIGPDAAVQKLAEE